ncbi:MAG: sigma factor, partial [Alloprevotella sp.]|nr:sigma factor [Alloprevotella sp.]
MIADKHILRATRDNPDRGFRLLLDKYQEPVYWHIRRLVVDHEDARDAAQETFIRACRHISAVRDADGLRPWLFRIAT